MRQDYRKFVQLDAEIIVVSPETRETLARYWSREGLEFIGLPDPEHTTADLYNQRVRLLKLGRLPALIVIDKNGQVRHSHHGSSMRDIPKNSELIAVLGSI